MTKTLIHIHWQKVAGGYILADHDYMQIRAAGKTPVDALRFMMAAAATASSMEFLPDQVLVSIP